MSYQNSHTLHQSYFTPLYDHGFMPDRGSVLSHKNCFQSLSGCKPPLTTDELIHSFTHSFIPLNLVVSMLFHSSCDYGSTVSRTPRPQSLPNHHAFSCLPQPVQALQIPQPILSHPAPPMLKHPSQRCGNMSVCWTRPSLLAMTAISSFFAFAPMGQLQPSWQHLLTASGVGSTRFSC